MINTPSPPVSQDQLTDLRQAQKNYFYKGQTRDLDFRITHLEKLKKAIQSYEKELTEALHQDLKKSSFEAYATEIGFVLDEIGHTLKHLSDWVKIDKVKTPVVHQPAQSYIQHEPYGVTLIIGPWNYPFQLQIAPLIGALAAGNCAVLKPSEFTPATSAILSKMIAEYFEPQYVTVVEGGIEVNQALLALQWDYIFFTGSTAVGKIIMRQAAEHLTPVTLELGGKSPCIVDENIDLEIAARRIVWGKFINAGQTCVAPDYLLVPEALKPGLFYHIKQALLQFYGEDPSKSPDYPRVIHSKHFERLNAFLSEGSCVVGGQTDINDLYIAPTVLDQITWDSPIMEEEIFGPILPVLSYNSLDEALDKINQGPRPLALYLFSDNEEVQDKVFNRVSFGGGCINDTVIHLANPNLPFGGVGGSGMGAYHGKFSFDTFSHAKSVVKRPLKMDIKLRYPPYSKIKRAIVKQVIK